MNSFRTLFGGPTRENDLIINFVGLSKHTQNDELINIARDYYYRYHSIGNMLPLVNNYSGNYSLNQYKGTNGWHDYFDLFLIDLHKCYQGDTLSPKRKELQRYINENENFFNEYMDTSGFQNLIVDFFLEPYINISLLFMTGIRIGEATALSWNDIDFDTGILSITKNLIYKSQEDYRYGDTKTKASNRHIVLDKDTLELLRKWKAVQTRIIPKTEFILSYNGYPTQKHTLSHAIKRYSKLSGIHSIRVHDLRHSHASLLIQLGENPLIIRDRLGHEEIETTLGTYGHLYPNTNYEVANKLNGLINHVQ